MFYLFPEGFFNAFSPVVGAIELPVQCPNETKPPLQPAVRGEGEGKPQLQVGFGVKFVAIGGERGGGGEGRNGGGGFHKNHIAQKKNDPVTNVYTIIG